MRNYSPITCSKIFKEIKKSKPYHSDSFSIRCTKNNLDLIRIGIIASKKIGNAVFRNKCKRRIKSSLDVISKNNNMSNYDFVIVAKKELHSCLFKSLHSNLQNAIRKLSKHNIIQS